MRNNNKLARTNATETLTFVHTWFAWQIQNKISLSSTSLSDRQTEIPLNSHKINLPSNNVKASGKYPLFLTLAFNYVTGNVLRDIDVLLSTSQTFSKKFIYFQIYFLFRKRITFSKLNKLPINIIRVAFSLSSILFLFHFNFIPYFHTILTYWNLKISNQKIVLTKFSIAIFQEVSSSFLSLAQLRRLKGKRVWRILIIISFLTLLLLCLSLLNEKFSLLVMVQNNK